MRVKPQHQQLLKDLGVLYRHDLHTYFKYIDGELCASIKGARLMAQIVPNQEKAQKFMTFIEKLEAHYQKSKEIPCQTLN